MFLSKSFVTLGLLFRSLIHCALLSVCAVRLGSSFFPVCEYLVVLISAVFAEENFLSPLNDLGSLVTVHIMNLDIHPGSGSSVI